MKTTICAAWPGTGKTFICENTDTQAVEVEYWKYKDSGRIGQYVEDIRKHIGKVQYIFISTDPEGLKIVNKEGLDIVLVYPHNGLRNEYLDRYIERDSPPDFIGVFMKYWSNWLDELKEQDYCAQRILMSGEYVEDVLTNTKPETT